MRRFPGLRILGRCKIGLLPGPGNRPDTQSDALKRVPFSIIFQLSGILFQLSAASSAC